MRLDSQGTNARAGFNNVEGGKALSLRTFESSMHGRKLTSELIAVFIANAGLVSKLVINMQKNLNITLLCFFNGSLE